MPDAVALTLSVLLQADDAVIESVGDAAYDVGFIIGYALGITLPLAFAGLVLWLLYKAVRRVWRWGHEG